MTIQQPKMGQILKYGLVLWLSLRLTSCKVSTYFFHESANHTYTELVLGKNDTFDEYVYSDLQDEVTDPTDFGRHLSGTYYRRGDTLFLNYTNTQMPSSSVTEIYLFNGDNLVKLAPVTYSHHYLNMIFSPGKSSALRGKANYTKINWKSNF